MTIDAIEFPLIGRRISGATLWRTDISAGLNGDEVRNANWRDSLRRFNLSYGVKSLADQKVLEDWFIVCLGPVFGFLLRDWKDYKVTQAVDGLMTVTNSPTNTIFQLEKNYTNGFRSHRRKITRPQAGTVTIYDNLGSLIGSGYTLDTTTGIITFSGAQTLTPRWTGNFYVPARFEEDEIPWDIIKHVLATGGGYGDLPEVTALEVRE